MKDKPLVDNPWFPEPTIEWDENDPSRQGLLGQFVAQVVWPIGMFGLLLATAHSFPASIANLWSTTSSGSPLEIAFALLLVVLAVPVTLLSGAMIVICGHIVVKLSRQFKRRIIDRSLAYWLGPLPRPKKVENSHFLLACLFFLLSAALMPTALNPLLSGAWNMGSVIGLGVATMLTLFLSSLVYFEWQSRQHARKQSDKLESFPKITRWEPAARLPQHMCIGHLWVTIGEGTTGTANWAPGSNRWVAMTWCPRT
jgi:hypothetical protein